MPGDFGVTCMLVWHFYCILHTRPRAHRAPGIPCALNSERAGIKSKTRGAAACEIAKLCLNTTCCLKFESAETWDSQRESGGLRPSIKTRRYALAGKSR